MKYNKTNMAKNNLALLDNDDFFKRTFENFDRLFGNMSPRNDSFPPTNIKKTNEGYIIELALAGYKKSDISIDQVGDELTIKAKKTEETAENSETYIHKGISSKSFYRSFYLGKGAEVTLVTLTDGILSVTISRNKPDIITKSFEIK